MNAMDKKQATKQRRAHRTRARLHGTAACPRLSVFRSAKHFSAQLIDDDAGRTIVAVHDAQLKDVKGAGVDVAKQLGAQLGAAAKKVGVTEVVFDRGPYAYHGRVKAFAEGARESGLTF